MAYDFQKEEGNEEVWKMVLIEGHPLLLTKKKRFGILPKEPRCKLCLAPFEGVGGWALKSFWKIHKSKRNPTFCNACDSFLKAYPGGTETPMTMLFVDIRNSVALSSEIPARDFRDLVDRLRQISLTAMSRTDGSVLEFIGDGVIAVWPPGIAGADHATKALGAARQILAAARKVSPKGHELPIGIGVHTGTAFLGTISSASNDLQDISAFGREVNLVARLSAAASAGTALVSREAAASAAMQTGNLPVHHLDLKGIDATVEAFELAGMGVSG
ncbi:adenylate/guanylate cyclase domain-containing protein [Antarctobacter jejuensis]|uniref:adenylate/guanylate cyclase domain-containing protein n=1 Tax=Antarctobacter jejuensis TaxID=1439938 RepID=UPI003FCF9FA8